MSGAENAEGAGAGRGVAAAGRPLMLDVDEVRLEAVWHGPPAEDATTLVLLHEGLGCVSLWRDFPARLAAATGCGVLVYSRRGYGRSDPVPLPRPVGFMHDEATVLGRVLDVAGVRDAILIGHSDGASIALIHAGRDGDPRIRALALEAPHVFVEDITVQSIAEIGEVYRTTDLPAKLARHHGTNTECAFRGWNEVWLDPDFRAWNIEEYLPAIRVPVLVVQGEDDEYGTRRQVEAVAQGSSGPADRGGTGSVEIVMLERCGHSPHRDRPDATLEAVSGFVRRVLEGDVGG